MLIILKNQIPLSTSSTSPFTKGRKTAFKSPPFVKEVASAGANDGGFVPINLLLENLVILLYLLLPLSPELFAQFFLIGKINFEMKLGSPNPSADYVDISLY